MQKKLFWALALVAMAFSFAACDDDEGINYANGSISIDISGVDSSIPTPDSFTVTITNIGTTVSEEYTTESTSLDVLNVVPGIYDIVVSGVSSYGGSAYIFVGTAEDVEVLDGATGILATVVMETSKTSALVFKEVHFNGSMTIATDDAASTYYLQDTYFEVYNNGEETVYVDGVCLGNVLSCNTYDFSGQAENVATGDVDDYIWIKTYVWQIPGSGSDYPIAPGESFIIAANAIDHTELANSIDLTTAEFETLCEKYINAGRTDANAINMNLACTISSSGLANQLFSVSTEAWALFYPSEGLRADGEYLASTNYSTTYGQEILKEDVFDAFEYMPSSKTSDSKRLPSTLDAGWASTTNYAFTSIYRKTSSITDDGRYIYQDTNNTTDDFEYSDEPEIRRNGANRPSWATWTTVD